MNAILSQVDWLAGVGEGKLGGRRGELEGVGVGERVLRLDGLEPVERVSSKVFFFFFLLMNLEPSIE